MPRSPFRVVLGNMLADVDDGRATPLEEGAKECPFEGDGGGGDAESVRSGRVDEVDDMQLGMKLVFVVEGEGGGVDGGDEISSETGDVSGEVSSGGDGDSPLEQSGLLAMVSETCLR